MFIDNLTTNLTDAFHQTYGNIWILLLLFLFLGIATYTDLKNLKIPNKLNGAFLIIRILIIPIVGFGWTNIGGAILAFIALMIPAMVKMQKMGGDIKCLTVVGLYLGVYITPIFILIACIGLALYTGVQYVIFKKGGMLPFAPFFLFAHTLLTIIYFIVF